MNPNFNADAQYTQVQIARTVEVFDFQSNAISTGNGNELIISDNATSLSFEIAGNTGGTLVFEGAGLSGVYYPAFCKNLSTGNGASQSTGNDMWQIDPTPFTKFRVRISVKSSTAVSVNGKVVE